MCTGLLERCIYCARSQFVGLSSPGRLSLECTLLAYLADHTDTPSLLSPQGTKAAVSPPAVVGHQSHPEGNRMIGYVSGKTTRKCWAYFCGNEVTSIMTIQLVWCFVLLYSTKPCENSPESLLQVHTLFLQLVWEDKHISQTSSFGCSSLAYLLWGPVLTRTFPSHCYPFQLWARFIFLCLCSHILCAYLFHCCLIVYTSMFMCLFELTWTGSPPLLTTAVQLCNLHCIYDTYSLSVFQSVL